MSATEIDGERSMNIRKLAWKNLLRRKSRAVFTGLGIFLGIATFVAISSITSQMEGAVQDQLDRFGANIVVSPRTEQVSLGFGDIALGGTEVAHSRLTMADKERDRVDSPQGPDPLHRPLPDDRRGRLREEPRLDGAPRDGCGGRPPVVEDPGGHRG